MRRATLSRWMMSAALIPLLTAAWGQEASRPKGIPRNALYLPVTSKTVAWGYYWSESKPVMHMRAGETIVVDTLITSSPTGLGRGGVPPEKIEPELKEVYANYPAEAKGPGGHILTGPIYVDGAEPGDTLAVHIEKIDGRIDYAYNGLSGFLREDFQGVRHMRIIPLDWKTMTAHFAPGIDVPMHPFFGSIGVAPPPDVGRHSSVPPDMMGGNMDNKDLVAGTTIYFPVFVPGALLEVGDGHAGQGDGEVDQTAMETSLRGTFRVEVIKGTGQKYPRAETPTQFISMGFDPDLTKATKLAIEQMIDFLSSTKGMSKADAYQLISVAGDVHDTELVDQSLGVHVLVPKAIFRATDH
ncbi:MAG: acetamidase/formamidase family protein [Terriglobales bacterium]